MLNDKKKKKKKIKKTDDVWQLTVNTKVDRFSPCYSISETIYNFSVLVF